MIVLALAGLTACVDDTPYTRNYGHVRLTSVTGPGSVTCEVNGVAFEPPSTPDFIICAWGAPLNAPDRLMATAIPDEGHEFLGWTGDIPSDRRMENPLVLAPDRNIDFGARFK